MSPSHELTRKVLLDLLDKDSHGLRSGWVPFRHGIDILRIYGDGEHGPAAALLWYAPGAAVPRHRHPDYEHILVLSGSQSDENGTYGAGSCVIHGPGTHHSVRSEDGCVVLAVWNQPVIFEAE